MLTAVGCLFFSMLVKLKRWEGKKEGGSKRRGQGDTQEEEEAGFHIKSFLI